MKIVLVGINSKYIHSNLAIRYLKTYTEDLNYDCIIKEFSINDIDDHIIERIMEENADIVAFSCYIWNMEFIKRISNVIKLINPKIEILYGGPEVTYNAKKFLEENCGEYLIEGEGEVTFKNFVKYKLKEKNINEIKGLYYKQNNEVKFNGISENINMNDLKFPYIKEDDMENKIIYYESSRGCPFKCKYCLSSVTNGVRFLDVERVKKELKYFVDNDIKLIKFVDRTFNCNKKYTKEIWSYLCNLETDSTFHFEIAADLLTDEEIEILNNAPKGRLQLEIGVQTTNIDVLHNINRVIKFENLKEKVLEIGKNKNVGQHLDLIAGLPGESFESFKKSFNDVYSVRPDQLQLGFLKLLKGSLMRIEAEKWGIVYSPYAPYEILKNNDLSYKELLKLKKVEEMLDKYYNSARFKNVIEFLVTKYCSAFDLYYDLSEFFEEKGYFDKKINTLEYYKALIDFNNKKFNGEFDIELKELLKYDYLEVNKRKWVPEFLIRDLKKDEERELREFVKSKYNIKKFHIEKYKINPIEYEKSKIILFEKIYLLYNEEDNKSFIKVKLDL